jgi:cytochrome c biogenesis protein CcmG, thiol:disulfide interchange protein DsbE
MRRVLFLLPVAVFAVLVAYFWVALYSGRDPHELPSAMIDKPAPSFALAGLNGAPGLDRTALSGTVAIVNFFASWCVPCRVEAPLLAGLTQQLKVPLYGIAYKDKPNDTEDYLKELGDPYQRIGLDENGRVGINFGVYGVPETYVIDKEGRIRMRFVGPLNESALTDQLKPLIDKLGKS